MEARSRSLLTLRAAQHKAELRAGILQRHPALLPTTAPRSALKLGHDERGRIVAIDNQIRAQHAFICGATGSGKTKLIEHAIRQDILDGRGVCLLDPHGSHRDSCYRSILSWMAGEGLTRQRTVHLVDPNAGGHVTGFNPLAVPDADYDPAVIADAVLEAIERLWGEEDTNSKPTLQRVLTAAITALCELRLTLNELQFLFDDPDDEHSVRAWMLGQLRNAVARNELVWLDGIAKEPRGRSEFRLEVTGPRNRFAKLLHLESLALMLGQQERGIDFRKALDEGHVVLVNLAPGPRLSDKAAQLLGRLLLRMLFFMRSGKSAPIACSFFTRTKRICFCRATLRAFSQKFASTGSDACWRRNTLANFDKAVSTLLTRSRPTRTCKWFSAAEIPNRPPSLQKWWYRSTSNDRSRLW